MWSASLGDRVRDKTTGLVGVVTGLATYTDREDQAYIEGIDSTGRPIGEWVPVARLEPVSA